MKLPRYTVSSLQHTLVSQNLKDVCVIVDPLPYEAPAVLYRFLVQIVTLKIYHLYLGLVTLLRG